MVQRQCGLIPEPEPAEEYEIADDDRFITDPDQLEEKGRLQFFFHSPESELPIRDVTNEQGKGQKTEPYLEAQAENFCSECYQKNNILPFLKSRERYLFLQTTCRNPSMEASGKRFVVGYLEKELALDMGSHIAVKGPISLYSFDDGYPGSELDCNTDFPRQYKLNTGETRRVLNHFEEAGAEDIFEECLEATIELENEIGRDLGTSGSVRDSRTDKEDNCGC